MANGQREMKTTTWVGVFMLPFSFTRFPASEDARADREICEELALRLAPLLKEGGTEANDPP